MKNVLIKQARQTNREEVLVHQRTAHPTTYDDENEDDFNRHFV